MKKLFVLTFLTIVGFVWANAQTVLINEDFESGPFEFTSSGSTNWAVNTRIYALGAASDSCTVVPSGTAYFTSAAFSTLGNSNVMLEFSHICKINPQDTARIEYSLDGGTTWVMLTVAQYQGSGSFANNYFCESSYPDDWQYVGATVPPTNSWWKSERFDLSAALGNKASVMIRFRLKDGGTIGSGGRAGWFLDNVKLTAAISELNPPSITQLATIWQDTIFGTGPFQVNATISDASGIDTAYIVYSVNSGANDTIPMALVSGSNYSGNIPSQGYLTHVDYYITAFDASLSHNTASTATKWFYNKKAPPSVIIGTGTSYSSNNPACPGYDYSWSHSIYTASDISYAGFIDSVLYQVYISTPPYTLNSQKIFFEVTSQSEFTTAEFPDTSTMTKVFDGNFTMTGNGWQKVEMLNPFFYNGSGNLHIVWINNDGVYSYGPNFYYSDTDPAYRSKYDYQDNSMPTGDGTLTYDRPNLKIVFQDNNAIHDVGLTSMTSPDPATVPVVSTPYDVKVVVRNFGSDTLTTATINWTLNGIVQTPYTWNGTLAQDQSSTPVTIGSAIFPATGNNTIVAWTTLPDGFPDEAAFNDTVSHTYFVCGALLAGTYTIDPVQPTSGTNFQTFSEVILALGNCGISDTTVFQVVNGTYNAQLNIPKKITGVGPNAIVVFESQSGNAADAILQFPSTGSSNNYIINLDSISKIQFKNLTFKALGTTYGTVVQLSNETHDILFENNVFEGVNTTNTSTYQAILNNSSSTNDSNIVIRGNTFINGSYGMNFYGYGSSSLESGNIIENNVFENYYVYGIYSYYQDGIVIRGNTFTTNSGYSSVNSLYLAYNDFSIIESNKISQPTYYGVYLYYSDGSGSLTSKFINNFVSVGGTATSRGLYVYYSNYFDFMHNSIHCYGTSAASGAAIYYTSSNNNTFNNNIFANTGGGYAFYAASTTFASNYNDLFTSGTNLGYYSSANRTTLSAWQTASGQDGNSVSVNPSFFSNTDLHTISTALDDIGTAIGTATDIDGEARNIAHPDMGADEFEPMAGEAGIISVISPIGGCSQALEQVTIQIKNNGYAAVNGSLNASYVIDALAPVTEAVSTPIPAGGSIMFTFTTLADLTTGATDTDFDFKVYVSLVGDNLNFNDTALFTVTSLHSANPVTISNATIPYGTSTTLTALSTDTVQWFSDAAMTNLLQTGSSFTTPILYDTTVYYVASTSGFEYKYTFDTDLQGWIGTTPCSYTTYNWAWNSDAGAGTAYMSDPTTYSSSMLKSPVIGVYGDEVQFSFRHKYGTESGYDNGYVAYRIDGGAWTHFTPSSQTYPTTDGLSTDPLLASCVYGPTVGVFTGTSAYITSSGTIPINGGTQLEVAFVFSTDGSGGGTGWFIDDVNVIRAGCPGIMKEDTVFITGIPANDMGVASIIQPASGIELATETVEVQVTNYGTTTASGFNVSYSINGGTPVTEPYVGSLAPGQSANFTFAQTANLSAYTTYNFKAYTTYAGDVIAPNDTAYKSVTNTMLIYCTCSASSTGYEDLTGLSIGTTSYTNPAANALYTDYTNLTPFLLAPGQSYPISVSSDFEPTYSYQYDCWVNVFIDYNHDGDFTDAGELVFGSATTSSNTVSGNFTVPLAPSNGVTMLRVAFEEGGDLATTGPCGTFTWGEVEDYLVNITPPIPEDAGVTSIVSPGYIQSENTSVPVIVNVYNFGTSTLSSIPIEYVANGSAPVLYTWNGTLLPGNSVTVTLPNVDVLSDSNDICAYTVVPGDSNTFNDQSCAYFIGLPPGIIFEDDMEGGTLLNTDAATLWQYGIPTASVIDTAYSPVNVWATVLAGNYPNSASGYLYTPNISFAGITGAYLTFYYWMDGEENLDGGFAQYSTNNGSTWSALGSIGDPNGYNWFDTYVSTTPGWSVNTNGWKPAFLKVDMVSGYGSVKFRFGFKSNTTTTHNGFAIDDIKILGPAVALDAGVVEILTPIDSTIVGDQITVSVRIKNFGTSTLNSIPVTYRLSTGFPPQTGTWTGTLLPEDTTTFTFTQKYPGPPTNYELCAYTALVGDPYKANDSTCAMLYFDNGIGFEDLSGNGVVLLQNIPNPASTQTEISFTLPAPGNCVITLRNTLGELIQTTQLSGQTGKNSFNINVDGLEQGIYIYTLEYKDVMLTRRLSVMR